MKTSEFVKAFASEHSRSETIKFALHLLGMDTSFLDDGGPGSGNWGHRGRPGKVGGSGKGGGKQYRGGRADIAYAGSRKDWLNGLSGERQHSAQKFMKEMKSFFEGSTKGVEQSIMESEPHKAGNGMRRELLEYMSEARGWDDRDNAKRLMNENWEERDMKLADALAKKYGRKRRINGFDIPDDEDTSEWDDKDLACWQDLKSKVLGGPVSGREAPDELQYESGLKERPKKLTNEWTKKLNPDERIEAIAALRRMTGIQDDEPLRRVLDDPEAMENMEKNAFSRAVGNYQWDRGLKRYMRVKWKFSGLPEGVIDQVTPEMSDRLSKLTDEEQNKVITALKMARRNGNEIFEDLDYYNQEDRLELMGLINKMLDGPDAKEEVKKGFEDKKRREEEERKAIEEERKRKEEEEKRIAAENERIRQENARKRQERLAQGISNYTELGDAWGVEKREVKKLEKPLNEDEIVRKLAGGDKTTGSCMSLAWSYAANKLGLDVTDFRGGKSCELVSKKLCTKDMVASPSVKSEMIEANNDIKAAKELLKKMEPGKEYLLVTGRHGAIVRIGQNGYPEYLEMQSSIKNGWKPFEKDTLHDRFGCKRSHTHYGMKLDFTNFLIDINSLSGCKTFENALQYINTASDQQKKGEGGFEK